MITGEKVLVKSGEFVKYPARLKDLNAKAPSHIRLGASATSYEDYELLDVEATEKPSADVVAKADPIVIDGVWTQQWTSRDFTTEELVPAKISMRQARLVLNANGLLDTITNAINASSDEEMKIEWEYATEVERNWTSLVALTASLGMSSDDVDNLFIAGKEL